MPNHGKVKTIDSFKGLNNVLKPENTPDDYLKVANNVDIDKKGKVSVRHGYVKKSTGSYTSIWSNNSNCYAIKDGDLVEVLPDYTEIVLKANIGTDTLSFEEVNGVVYFISNSVRGIIEGSVVYPWGIDIPSPPTLTSGSTGLLLKGVYQVTYTYVTSDGLESGASYGTTIEVEDNSNISLSVPATDASIISARVYCSTQNGRDLYYVGSVVPGSSFIIDNTALFSNPLKMFNLSPPPYGTSISYYKGRLYITEGSILWYSEPNQYSHFKLDSNYLDLPENIIEVIPVEDGLWVCTDDIYYISGSDPSSFKLTLKERVTIVPGTATRFSGSYIQLDNTPIGYKWLITTNLGIFVLFNQGMIINLTATNLSLDRGVKGTSLFLQDKGINQYLSTIEKENKPNNSVMGDLVTTSIIRNGITL